MEFVILFSVVLFMLCCGHAIAEMMPRRKDIPWPYDLFNHAVIHGGAVMTTSMVLTQNIFFSCGIGFLEFICHFVTDWSEHVRNIDIHTDQIVHYSFKIVWVFAILKQMGVV